MTPEGAPAALTGVRVLDLAETHAAYATRLLADLGAEVICVEPPGGSAVRRLAPMDSRTAQGMASFVHLFLNAGKRSVVLDRTTAAGAAQFRKLAEAADVIIHTPGASDTSPLDIGELRAADSKLIVASITPFGLSGPYASFSAGALTELAAGGLLSLGGYRDTAPIAIQGGQAQLAAGLFAAVAVLAALCARQSSGKGAWIDVSAQECVAFALEDGVAEWCINHRQRHRLGEGAREAGTGIYPCEDGYISIVAGRMGTMKSFAALTKWITESDVPGAARLLESDWQDIQYRQSEDGIRRFADLFHLFCRGRTKSDLYAGGQARQIAIAPVNTIADLLSDPQLSANHFFTPHIDSGSGRNLTFPGSPFRLSLTPASPRSEAPTLARVGSVGESGWSSSAAGTSATPSTPEDR